MQWKQHWRLKGQHAILSASKHRWLHYDDEQLKKYLQSAQAAKYGTELHDFAEKAIKLKRLQPDDGDTLNMHINDAIRMHMEPEVILYYSEYVFGTADAIKYVEEENFLAIHDYKSGVNKASIDQLICYAAIFFLEYGKENHYINPNETGVMLCIYQNGERHPYKPTPEELIAAMDRIVTADKMMHDDQSWKL